MQYLAKCYAEKASELQANHIISIALFGSVARGQAGTTSDIDLFIVIEEAPSGMLNRRRLLDPVRKSLTSELEKLWKLGIYMDFVEAIRTRDEARKFHPLYLNISQLAIVLFYRDKFLEILLSRVKEQLKKGGAERKIMGRFRYWDLSRSSIREEIIEA